MCHTERLWMFWICSQQKKGCCVQFIPILWYLFRFGCIFYALFCWRWIHIHQNCICCTITTFYQIWGLHKFHSTIQWICWSSLYAILLEKICLNLNLNRTQCSPTHFYGKQHDRMITQEGESTSQKLVNLVFANFSIQISPCQRNCISLISQVVVVVFLW